MLHNSINSLSDWLKRWTIKLNENKSVHVAFALKCGYCPPVFLNKVMTKFLSKILWSISRDSPWQTIDLEDSHVSKWFTTEHTTCKIKLDSLIFINWKVNFFYTKLSFKPYGLQLWGFYLDLKPKHYSKASIENPPVDIEFSMVC